MCFTAVLDHNLYNVTYVNIKRETLLNGAVSEAGTAGHISFGVAAGVVLVLVIVVVLAVITDLSCYFVNRCGITMCICRSLGRSPGPITGSQSREKAMEEGERSVTVYSYSHLPVAAVLSF